MMKNRAIWLAVIVLALASVLMIFVVLPAIDNTKSDPKIASGTGEAPQTQKTPQTPETPETPVSTQPVAPSAETKKARVSVGSNAGQDTDIVPSFDLLRVEKDGSTVIAGKGTPGGRLDILDDDKSIASSVIGPSGDFAAVLDNPLAPGDHQITLKVTRKDGQVLISEEVATVSVPKEASGELLAMVTKPGQASRIITAPVAKNVAVAGKVETKATPPDAIPEWPGLPAGAKNLAGSPPSVGSQSLAVKTTEPGAASPVPQVPQETQVHVSAIEIEGDHIFVAGSARPGALVRIYVDDQLIGEAKADANGRFLVDKKLTLAIGTHIIRSDVLSNDGSKVEFRASVPFERPQGEQLAVVADPSVAAGAQAPMVPIDSAQMNKAQEDVARALSLLKGLFANGKTPGVEELAAARSASEIALKALSEMKSPGDLQAMAIAQGTTKALAALKALGSDAASVGAGLATVDNLVAPFLPMPKVVASANVPPTTSVPAKPPVAAEPSVAAEAVTPARSTTEAPGAATTEIKATGPKTIEQAALKPSKTSVIIRKGDTLWQISRRVYGQGVRYTTIYIANQEQITDPDRILPGQIFGVPDKPLDNAEELHRKQLKANRN